MGEPNSSLPWWLSIMCSTRFLQFGGKLRKRSQLVGDHPHRDQHMAEQLAFGRVGEAAVIAQLVNLADIVQHGAGDQQIEVDRSRNGRP